MLTNAYVPELYSNTTQILQLWSLIIAKMFTSVTSRIVLLGISENAQIKVYLLSEVKAISRQALELSVEYGATTLENHMNILSRMR